MSERFSRRRPLGRGGSGVVFEAVDEETGALVALKTVHTKSADEFVRLKEEFRALAGVHHPNLVDLYQLIATEGECLLAMELVEGTTFLEYVRPGARTGGSPASGESTETKTMTVSTPDGEAPATAERLIGGVLDVTRLRSALAQLVDGLGALHGAGKIHRDLKPGNVLVTHDGRVKLLDFGLAMRTGDRAEHVEGTPLYMAPEQIAGEAATPATDAYALGVMLYQSLTGRTPFADRATAMIAKLKQRPPAVREVAPEAPSDLADLCDRLLSTHAVDRPSGAEIGKIVGSAAYADARAEGELLGRAAETARLLATIEEARGANEARLLLVTGPSGVGKSALVEEVCRRVELETRGVVLRGRCSEREVVPYPGLDGIVDGLRTLLTQWRFDEVRSASADARRDLGQLFPIVADRISTKAVSDAVEARAAAARGLHELFSRVAGVVPLVVVLDDMQWITEDAAAILAGALRGVPFSVTLLATVRETNATERPGLPPGALARMLGLHADTCALGRLDLAAARALVRRAAGAEVPLDAVDRLVGESGGHPLLLDMLARSWTRGASPVEGDRALVELPLAGVDPFLKTVLGYVAIASEGITLECLADVVAVPLATVVGVANELQRLRLVRASGIGRRSAVTVAHDRIRAAALATIDAEQARAMHRATASVTERLEPERVEVLVHHFEAGGDTERVGRYARAAGDVAARVLAFDRAARWYALALARSPTADPSLRAAHAEVLAFAGQAIEAGRAFELAADEKGGDAVLLHRATDQYLRAGAVERGIALLARVLRPWGIHVPRSPRGALVALLFRRAQLWFRGLEYRARTEASAPRADLDRVDALTAASSGLALVDNILGSYFQTTSLLIALRAGEPGRIVRALALEASYSSSEGPVGSARTSRLLARARQAAESVDTSEARAWTRAAVAFSATLETHWTVGLEAAKESQRVFRLEVPGSHWEVSTLRLFESFSLAYLGRYGELRRLEEERHADAIARGDVHAQVIQSTSTPGISLVAADEAEHLIARLDAAMSIWNREGFHVEHWWRAYALVSALLYLGRVQDAERELTTMWPGLERSLLLMVHLTRCEAWLTRGSTAIASLVRGKSGAHARVAARAEKLLSKEKSPFGRGLGACIGAARARIEGDVARAERCLALATEAFVQADMPAHAAAARWSLAKMHGDDEARGREEAAMRASGIARPSRFVSVMIAAHDLADPA